MAVGFNDGRIRIYMIHPPWLDKETNPIERIDELQDHTALITATEWSRNPSTHERPRLLSGSFDGTARIWSYARQTWTSIVLHCTDGLDGMAYTGDAKKRPKVNDAIWLDRDQYVAIAVTGEREQNMIKIFNSESGILIHNLANAHREHIRCLKMHPVYSQMFVSTGSDGLVVVWNSRTGQKMTEDFFPSTVETGEPVQIHDAKWSKKGMELAIADSQGHLGIMGFGKNDKYCHLPEELFFETDYHPLVTDADGYVIDEHTGMAPHLTNPGLYTNQHNEPHVGFKYQDISRARNESFQQRDVLGERIRLLAHQLDNSRVESGGIPSPTDQDENSMPALPNAQGRAAESWSMNRADQENVGKYLCKALSGEEIVRRNRRIRQHGAAEQQWYACERKKVPLHKPSPKVLGDIRKRSKFRTIHDIEDSPVEESTIQSDENHSIQGSDSEWAEPGNRPPPSGKTRRPYGHVPSPTFQRRSRRKKKKKRRQESGTSEISTQETQNDSSRDLSGDFDDASQSSGDTSNSDDSSDSSDNSETEDTETNTSLENRPGPSTRSLNIPSHSLHAFSHEKPSSRNSTPRKRLARRSKQTLASTEDDSSEDEKLKLPESLSRRLSREARSSGPSGANKKREISSSDEPTDNDDIATLTLPEPILNPPPRSSEGTEVNWIKHTQALRTPFLPQIGDEIYYVPLAHQKYCDDFQAKISSKAYRLRINEKVPKEIKRNADLYNSMVLCTVKEIKVRGF